MIPDSDQAGVHVCDIDLAFFVNNGDSYLQCLVHAKSGVTRPKLMD